MRSYARTIASGKMSRQAPIKKAGTVMRSPATVFDFQYSSKSECCWYGMMYGARPAFNRSRQSRYQRPSSS